MVWPWQPRSSSAKGEDERSTRTARKARGAAGHCFPGQVYGETSALPRDDWIQQIPYQWAATVKAELFQRDC
jgi:hypothetical protein